MVSINTNLSSLIAQRSLTNSTQLLNEAIERMSTGFQINGAKDNAANYAISTNMSTRISSYEVAEDNAATALDLVSTASSSLDQINDHLSRLRSLATQAGNGTYGEQSLNAINQEANAIIDEIERLYGTTSFNGISLFNKQTNNVVTNSVNRLSNSVRIVTPEIQTKSLSSTPKVLSETEEIEAEADESTSFDELGINGGSFGVYNSAGDLQNEYTLDGLDTIGKFIELLNNSGFEAKIENGVISVKSDDGSYISGALADSLGIEVTNSTQTTGASTSSTLSVTYTETVTASTSTTFGELGATGNLTGIIYDETNSACNTITVKTTDTIGDMISKLAANNITATIKNGVVSFESDSYYTLTQGSQLGTLLGISRIPNVQNLNYEARHIFQKEPPIFTSDTSVTGTSVVKAGGFKAAVNKIDTTNVEPLSNYMSSSSLAAGTYKISTTEELVYLLSEDLVSPSDSVFIIDNDIDMSGISYETSKNEFENCVIEGNGHIISNLSGENGLFEDFDGEIRNLGLTNVNITNNDKDTYVGAFAGHIEGKIYNCFVTGTISAEGGYYLGGLVGGAMRSNISESYVSATIASTSRSADVGGLAASIQHTTITDSYSEGHILAADCAGGIVGRATLSEMENVFSSVSMEYSRGGVTFARMSGIVAELYNSSLLYRAYFNGTISNDINYSGLIVSSASDSSISRIRYDAASDIPAVDYWSQRCDSNDKLSEAGVTSGLIGIYKNGVLSDTISLDSELTLTQFMTLLRGEGFDAEINSANEMLTITSDDMYLGNIEGSDNLSNIMDYLSFETNTITIYENTTSAVQNVITSKSLTETSELQDLPDYNNGNGEISVVQSDGSKTTIKVSPTDTIGTLFSKLSQFGIVGSLNSGLVSLESTNGAYIEQAAGGSNLFDSLNLKPVEIEKEEIPVNTDSDKLTVTTPSGGDGDGGTDPVDPGDGNQGGGTNPPTDPDGGNTGGGTKPPTDPDGGNNTGSGGSGNQGGNNGNGGGNTGGISPITPAPDSIIFQVGIDSDWSSQIGISTSFELTGLDELRNIGIDDKDYLSQIDNLLSTVNAKQTEFGAAENRLMSVLEEISIHYDNLVSSRSTLRDADIAEVSSEYIRQQILQQASATLLSTANQTPAIALQLI